MNFTLNKNIYLLIKFSIWFFFAVFGLYYLNAIKSRETVGYELLLCVGIIQLSIISFIDRWYKSRPSLLDWFRFTTFYTIILNYFLLIDKLDRKIIWMYGSIYLNQNKILDTLVVVFIGLVALKISENIVSFIKKKKKELSYNYNSNAKIKNINYKLRYSFLFYLLGIIVFSLQLILLLNGVIGYGTFGESAVSSYSFLLQILNGLGSFMLLTLGFQIMYYKNKDVTKKIFLYLFLALAIIFGLLSGMKEYTIIPILSFLIPYFLGGNTIPKKVLFVSVISVAFIYPINDNYRAALNSFDGISKTEAFGYAVTKTFASDINNILSESSDKFSDRVAMFPILIYTIDIEKDWHSFKEMDRFVYLPFSYLPRVLLPSKPVSDTGAILNKMITGRETNSQTPTTYGWAYLEGGNEYVFLSFLIFGLIISIFNINVKGNTFFSLLFFSNVLIMMLKVETDVYFLLAKLIQDFLVFSLVYFIFIKKIVL